MTERHIQVHRTARYHQIGDPNSARSMWIVVHGYGQLARYFLNSFTELAKDRIIIAPEGLSRFYIDKEHQRVGATWMTREDREHEITDHIGYLDRVHSNVVAEVGELPLGVLGFSQGVATVARWITSGQTRPMQVVLWGGSLPPELSKEQLATRFRGMRIDLVRGKNDELVPASVQQNNEERLLRAGANVNSHVFPGGHSLDQVLLSRCMAE